MYGTVPGFNSSYVPSAVLWTLYGDISLLPVLLYGILAAMALITGPGPPSTPPPPPPSLSGLDNLLYNIKAFGCIIPRAGNYSSRSKAQSLTN